MIRHQTIRKELDRAPYLGFEQQRLECRVIVRTLKKWDTLGGSIENVKDDPGGSYPKTSRHGR
jgi:hypothetical protein